MYRIELSERELLLLEEGINNVLLVVKHQSLKDIYRGLSIKFSRAKEGEGRLSASTDEARKLYEGLPSHMIDASKRIIKLYKEYKKVYKVDLYHSIASVYDKAPINKKGEAFSRYYYNRWKDRRKLLVSNRDTLDAMIDYTLRKIYK